LISSGASPWSSNVGAIKKGGEGAFAQDGASSGFLGMPNAPRRPGHFVLSVDEIPTARLTLTNTGGVDERR
jgi:hypothetical protein